MQVYWVDKFNRNHNLKSMTTGHVMNIIRMIVEGRMRRDGCSGFNNAEWLAILRTEVLKRIRGSSAQV